TWNAGDSKLLRFPGQTNGTQGFVDRKRRAAEESDLLPCHQRTGAGTKLFDISERRGRRTPGAILPFENISDTPSAACRVCNASALVFRPLHKTRRTRIELLNIRSRFEIVEEQLGTVGNLPEWETVRFHD